MRERIVDECGACGEDVVEGTPHDCPVLGALVTVSADLEGGEMTTKRDEVEPGERWAFDEDVAEAFDDMLARSIPQYDVMREVVFEAGARFVQPKTAIIDLGCSRGQALQPFTDRFGAHNRYVGVEVSAPMLEAARERFAPLASATAWDGGWLLQVRELDLRVDFPPEAASLILSVLTLQFTPIEYRQKILNEIYDHLLPGGALLIVEKVIGQSRATDELMTDLYHAHKRTAGYSEEQIVRKAAALEGVLVPLTARMNTDLLRAAGFEVECLWRWCNFTAWVAVRRAKE